mmetsp:Transcript_7666/g.20643  ORF Transcript_7666/g.20643 Transcript_7666/m.20643 type:complete len:724 (+) Transcript_7666:136-2307(+)
MRRLAARLAVLVIAAITAARGETFTEESYTGNPVQKVVQLIGELEAKVIKDGVKEQKTYDKYVRWCGQTSREKQSSVKENSRMKESLEATISKASDDSDAAKVQILDLAGSIATDNSDLRAATLLREKETKDFEAFDDDLGGTIQTLARAREVLKKELKKGGLKAAASFLQRPTAGMSLFAESLGQLVDAAEVISGQDRKRLVSLIETAQKGGDSDEDGELNDFEDLDLGAPKAAVYASSSTPLLETLKELQGKSEDSQREARGKETGAQRSFELLRQPLQGKIAAQDRELVDARKDKAEADEAKADAESKMHATTKDLQADQAYLAKLHRQCMDRASAFEEQQRDRKAEMKALGDAKKVVMESAMSAGGKVYSFVQRRSRVRRHKHATGLSTENAQVAFKEIQKLATSTGSVAMVQLVSRLSAAMRFASSQGDIGTGDPFAKVNEIIRTMIEKLEVESSRDAKQKAFCDREMAVTLKSREVKEGDGDELSSKLDSISSGMANVNEALKTLAQEVTQLVSGQAELDQVRAEEEANFKEARQDLQDGLGAIRIALKVLRKYYGEHDDSSSLMQDAVGAGTASADGQSSERGGDAIIGLLEVVEADFAKHLSERVEQDASAKDEYEDITQKNTIAKATMEDDVRRKNGEMSKLRKKAAELQSDSEDTKQELQAVKDYLKQLTPKCAEEPETAQQRLEARRVEMEGLRSALAALEGEASKAEADDS